MTYPKVEITAGGAAFTVGESVPLTASVSGTGTDESTLSFGWALLSSKGPAHFTPRDNDSRMKKVWWHTKGLAPGEYTLQVAVFSEGGDRSLAEGTLSLRLGTSAEEEDPTQQAVRKALTTALDVIEERRPSYRGAPLPVSLQRTQSIATPDEILWMVIRKTTDNLSFKNYMDFIDTYFCPNGGTASDNVAVFPAPGRVMKQLEKSKIFLPFSGVDAYRKLKAATEVFLVVNTGVLVDFDALLKEINKREEETRIGRAIDEPERLWNLYLEKVNGVQVPPGTPPVASGGAAPGTSPASSRVNALPYLALIRHRLPEVPLVHHFGEEDLLGCFGILQQKLSQPIFVELIWNYWLEEATLVQTMNHISRRFQNVRGPGAHDPLANMEIGPLRPINNLLWGYVQDEQHRLSVVRRAHEYEHEYGFTLHGKAVVGIRSADRRSKFIESFHNLLYQCVQFFRQDDDTTVVADGFPVLNSVKETHYLLAYGAHNQFGDLPSTARQEMLMQMWLLARPEMREFIGGREMMPYQHPWMDRVDMMKSLLGWTDVSVVHFYDLAVFGEQLLLSLRYGAWSLVHDPQQAANWARYWRPQIQGYIHAYRAATGVDLTADVTDQQRLAERYVAPSVHLRNRLATQRRR